MNFFGLGPGELMVIAVLALVVVGPKQLPSLLKQMGGWFGKAQQMQRDLRRGVDDIVRESELDGLTKTISQARNFTPAGAAERFINGEFDNAESNDWLKSNANGGADSGLTQNSIQPRKTVDPSINEDQSDHPDRSDQSGALVDSVKPNADAKRVDDTNTPSATSER